MTTRSSARVDLPPLNLGRAAKLALAAALVGLFAADLQAQLPPGQFQFRRGVRQPPVDGAEEQTAEGVFHGDRETRKQLKKAKKLLEDKRFSEALPLLRVKAAIIDPHR